MRATEPGLLAGIPGVSQPPADTLKREAAFSFVTDPSTERVKKLPSYFVNSAQVFAHRDAAAVRAQLDVALDAFRRSHERATYMLTACEIGDRRGLYGTDFFNRTPYRLKLKRLGMRFSDHPFVFFDGDGTFHAEEAGTFSPSFVTLGPPAGVEGAVETTGAPLLYYFASYRLADIGADELSALARLLPKVDALSAAEPEDLVAALGVPVA